MKGHIVSLVVQFVSLWSILLACMLEQYSVGTDFAFFSGWQSDLLQVTSWQSFIFGNHYYSVQQQSEIDWAGENSMTIIWYIVPECPLFYPVTHLPSFFECCQVFF